MAVGLGKEFQTPYRDVDLRFLINLNLFVTGRILILSEWGTTLLVHVESNGIDWNNQNE
jgi:hypothetical protein